MTKNFEQQMLRNREQIARMLSREADDGIPPFLVASNISVDCYKAIRLWKEDGSIWVESICIDDETDQKMTFVYRYTLDSRLQSIEMILGSKRDMIWPTLLTIMEG